MFPKLLFSLRGFIDKYKQLLLLLFLFVNINLQYTVSSLFPAGTDVGPYIYIFYFEVFSCVITDVSQISCYETEKK